VSLELRPIYEGTVTRIVKVLAARAGVEGKKIGAHTLRRSMATHLIENGASQYEVKGILRHAKLSTTDLYVQLSEKMVRGAYNEHIKPVLGKGNAPKPRGRKDALAELANLLREGKISEETFLILHKDLAPKVDDKQATLGGKKFDASYQ
jgi:hypothetical protein